jgi:Ca2+-binding EF-hand superfamily protein
MKNNEMDSSMNDPNYVQQISENLQKIQQAFKKIDKNQDDQIDKEELTRFLDSSMQVSILNLGWKKIR